MLEIGEIMPEATERDATETNRQPAPGPQPIYGFDDISDTFEPVYSTGNALHVKLVASGSASSTPTTQTFLTATGASQSLPTPPVGTAYALIQVKNQTLWFRLDSVVAASGGNAEQFVDPGGTLELTSAAEISGYRGIQGVGGVLSITYRGA